MTNQRLRVIAAFSLAVLSTVGIVMLAGLGTEIPDVLKYLTGAAYAYLFGVTTNGGGKPLG